FFILVSTLDLLGIGIIGPFLGVVFGGADNLPHNIVAALNLADYSHTELVTMLAAILIFIYTIKSIFGALIMRSVITFSQNQQVHHRQKLITSYQNMPYSKMIQRNSSDYVNAIQLMVPNYANLVMFFLQAVGDSIVAIMIIGFLAWTNPQAFGFLVLISGICLVGFDRVVRNLMTNAGRDSNESAASIVRHTNESLRGFKEIRVLKQERFFNENLVEKAVVFASAQSLINFISMLPKYIFEMIIIIFIAGISITASHMVSDPVTLIPTLGVFGMASIRMIPLARSFSFTLSRIRYSKDTVMKLAADLEEAEKASQATPLLAATAAPKIDNVDTISLKGISYTYPGANRPALNDITLEIKEGDHVGIVGTSGAGKTTLVDTLLGLLPPSAGQILVNGIPITQNPEALWQHVAYLPQEIFIIDGSVRHNIALGVPVESIDDNQLDFAIKQAQMDDVISNLPDGLTTNLGENGVKLSGGQRQRIALARAFYFNRRILVLDEATSSLDVDTESQIINYLKGLKNKITVISITHRAKSLEHCDRILTIDDGHIKLK
ncbi:MAG: ABC transporter ATP-binding protein, partial [Alphaproteobacteria bacterium]|nr:ABC transporter ATP-binding protein [Alphaproteobacteria bacterium]